MVGGGDSKKLKVEENFYKPVNSQLLISIEKLQDIQDKLQKINEEANDKVLEIEQKYNEIRKPVYENRDQIIKSVPDFWLTAFLNHPALGQLLNDEDEEILKYLGSVEVEDNKDVKSGYTITFSFKPNPYFEDTKLIKTYTFLDEGTTKITATPIKWKEGQGILNGDSHKKNGTKRAYFDVSFFSWFTDCEEKDDDKDDIHDEVAELIKDDLWPNPLTYFNNGIPVDAEVLGEPDYEQRDEEDSDSEDDDDDEGDDDDDDDDEGGDEEE